MAISAAAVIWVLLLFIQGVPLRLDYLHPYSIAVAVVVLGANVFDFYLWRVTPFRWVVSRPLLRGTWRGQLTSNWGNRGAGERTAAIEIYVAVWQTYSAIHVQLMSSESESRSLVATLTKTGVGGTELVSVYENVPELLRRGGSPIHYGTVVLNASGKDPHRLTGAYWTDRDTKGQIVLDDYRREVQRDFVSARASF